jgi:hypothetical protein
MKTRVVLPWSGSGKVLIHGGENAGGFPEPSTFLFE